MPKRMYSYRHHACHLYPMPGRWRTDLPVDADQTAANMEEGLLRPVLSVSTKEELIWSISVRGHNLTFRLRDPGASFLTSVEIAVDGHEPVSSMGSMVFGENKEVFNFAPVPVSLDAVRLPLFVQLERYRHVSREFRPDPARPSGESGLPGVSGSSGFEGATKVEYVPYVAGWDLLIGNAEAFTGRFERKRGQQCTLWLFDADLNGVFGDQAAESGGDLLFWEYGEGVGGFMGIGRHKSGVSALAAKMEIAGTKYAVSLIADGSDATVLMMTE